MAFQLRRPNGPHGLLTPPLMWAARHDRDCLVLQSVAYSHDYWGN
eukprot:gene39917-10383_t